MEAEELRTGNLVNYDGIATVIGISGFCIEYESENSYGMAGLGLVKPIPLNSEWLINLGFKEYKGLNGSMFKIKANKYLSLNDEKQGYLKFKRNSKGLWVVENFANKSITLQYLHQLQNLYFSITQKELIKQINR